MRRATSLHHPLDRFGLLLYILPKRCSTQPLALTHLTETDLQLPAEPPALEEIRRVVTVFRELRDGLTADGKTKLKSPSGSLSTAEAISVVNQGLSLAAHFGDGRMHSQDVASGLVGAVIKDPVQDQVVWREYLETVVKEREGWKDLYRACRDT